MDFNLWIPLLLIFASALLAGIIKRYTRDPALKIFHRSYVCLKLRSGNWIWGNLVVYSNCLELVYRDSQELLRYQKQSYVLFENELETIEKILRPSPLPETKDYETWHREINRLQHPSLLRRLGRHVRNFFNMIRDAFAQSIAMIFGAVKRKTRFATVGGADKVGEMGRALLSVVPNAFEPILEKYLGREVVVQSPLGDKVSEQIGLLQEYSSKYLLLRNVDLLTDLPPDLTGRETWQFDVAFPRPTHVIRHLAHSEAPERHGN